MITLTTPIDNPQSISRLVKWKLADAHDYDEASPPYLMMKIRTQGPGGTLYGADITLVAYDEIASTCLRVKAIPQSYGDLLELHSVAIPNLYSTLTAIWNGNTSGTGTKKKRLAAVEAALVSSGVLSPSFAGT